jgi:lipopolysaccharide transport system ATP-binding protein
MSSDNSVITADRLSKAYQIYQKPQHRFFQSLLRGRKQFYREFWALREISFTVARGETIGVLGRNGSGKSTLLQLIAGTLKPTSGSIRVAGRTSAILELGAGFNPEFTGRENAVLNTAILGMSGIETELSMDRIVEFADIGEFIDQPVKTYSSGMYARLAFAVAINVSPDVLIVDEALAVGDAKFQSQCFRKFEEFKKRGITILFVTHSVEQIVRHCNRALLLDRGALVMTGAPKAVAQRYLEMLFGSRAATAMTAPAAAALKQADLRGLFAEATSSGGAEPFESRAPYNRLEHRWGDGRARIIDFALVGPDGSRVASLTTGDAASLYLRVAFRSDIERPIFGLTIKTPDGVEVSGNNSRDGEFPAQFTSRRAGDEAVVKFDFQCSLNSGEYLLSVGVVEETGSEIVPLDRRYDSIHVTVINTRTAFGVVDLGVRVTEMTIEEPIRATAQVGQAATTS